MLAMTVCMCQTNSEQKHPLQRLVFAKTRPIIVKFMQSLGRFTQDSYRRIVPLLGELSKPMKQVSLAKAGFGTWAGSQWMPLGKPQTLAKNSRTAARCWHATQNTLHESELDMFWIFKAEFRILYSRSDAVLQRKRSVIEKQATQSKICQKPSNSEDVSEKIIEKRTIERVIEGSRE